MLAGSIAKEIARIGGKPFGGSMQSNTRSFASVAEPPLPKAINVPPACNRRVNHHCRFGESLRLFQYDPLAEPLVVDRFLPDRSGDLGQGVLGIVPLLPKKRIEERRSPRVVAERLLLEKDMDRFPQRVVHQLRHLLMDERIRGSRGKRMIVQPAGPLAHECPALPGDFSEPIELRISA